MTAIGPLALLAGTPAVLGPFTPSLGSITHALTFDVGAWVGATLVLECYLSLDTGQHFALRGSVTYGGPVSAWVTKTALAVTGIAPSFTLPDTPADADTRVQFKVITDGAFASTGGSYTSSA